MALLTLNDKPIVLKGSGEVGWQPQNIITFEYTPTEKTHAISHDTLVEAGIDTEEKFLKIIGISILPKNGDVDWFVASYGGALNASSILQHLTHTYAQADSTGSWSFYNAPTIPYMAALQSATPYDANTINKPFIVTILLSE